MTKFDYIIRQLSKTNKKNYENYVVSRIWHRLNNLDIKFITQQYIARPEGGYALTDMYFPQLNLHIEVDEKFHLKQLTRDKIREQDIIGITNHEFERVDISKGIDLVNEKIEQIVDKINSKIADMGDDFLPWNLEKEFNPETYIAKGYIHVKDNVAFEKISDACNCFGYKYTGFMMGGTRHPVEPNTLIWFPKLFPNGEWDNNISTDECTITEKNVNPEKAKKHIRDQIDSNIHRRIVFAKVKGSFGDTLYRFKGVFELDLGNSIEFLVWRRTSEYAKTYCPN